MIDHTIFLPKIFEISLCKGILNYIFTVVSLHYFYKFFVDSELLWIFQQAALLLQARCERKSHSRVVILSHHLCVLFILWNLNYLVRKFLVLSLTFAKFCSRIFYFAIILISIWLIIENNFFMISFHDCPYH